MRVYELSAQLRHDIVGHAELDIVLEYKDTAGNLIRYKLIGDRYVETDNVGKQTYVLRIKDDTDLTADMRSDGVG